MKSKSKPELGIGHAGKIKGKKTIKTRILSALKKKKRNIKKFFGRKHNTTSIDRGATTSNDVVCQVDTNIKGGSTSNKDVFRADTSITEVVIPASPEEPTTLDNVSNGTSTPSKEESKLHKNNKRSREDEIESTISSTSDITSPKTPLQDGEKSKQLDLGSGSWSGSWSESGSWSGSTRSRISPADIHPGICSPVRKRPKMAVNGTAESATKDLFDKKRKQPED